MSKAVNSKWKKTFPDTIGNQNRPATGVDDTQPFETGAFPQYMANDPVRYDLQNAAMSQLMSNDARLKEMVDARGKELDDHKVDPGAHKTGIAGNAATATKVVTTAASGASANIAEATMASNDLARIRVSGATNAGELALETAADGSEPIVARQYTGIYTTPVRTAKILDESGNTSFPGTVVAPKFTGALNGNAATATKLSTARKINITGNATGSAGFDGTSDVNINVTVNSATKAVNDGNGANIASTYVKKAGDTTTGKITFASTDLNTLPEVKKTSDDNMSGIRFSSKTKFLGAVGKRLSNGEDLLNLRSDNSSTDVVLDSRNYNNYAPTKTGGGASGTWGISITGNAASATTAGKADGGDVGSFIPGKSGYNDYSPTVGGPCANVTIDSWFGVSFTSQCGGSVPKGKTAVGIDCREGIVRANNFQGKWNSLIDDHATENNTDTWIPVFKDNKIQHTTKENMTVGNADKVDGYHASDLLGKIYPVGSIYMSMSATNPHDLFGVGTWKRISQGRMLLGADDSTYKAGATGGEATHTLTAAEMPAHSHDISTSGDHSHYFYGSDGNNGQFTEGDGLDTEANLHYTKNERFTTSSAGAHTHTISNSGGGAAHNNMSPYLVCYIWQRTA